MIDRRFNGNERSFLFDTIEICRQWRIDTEDFESLAERLCDWYLTKIPEGQNINSILDAFGENLGQQVRLLPRNEYPDICFDTTLDESFAQRVAEVIFKKGPGNANAEWLVGHALALFTIERKNDPVSLASAWCLALSYSLSRYSYQDTLEKNLGEDLMASLVQIVDCIAASPGSYVPSQYHADFRHALDRVMGAKSISIAWQFERHQPLQFHCAFVELINVIRVEKTEKYFSFLEKLGVPSAISEAYRTMEIAHDFEECVRLIKLAPSCFKAQKWNGEFVTPILLDHAFRHIVELEDILSRKEESDIETFRANERKLLLQALAQAVLEREDSVALISFWLVELMWRSQNRRMPKSTFENDAIDAFSKALATKVSELEFIQQTLYCEEEKDHFLRPGLLQALLVLLLVCTEQDTLQINADYLIGEYNTALHANELGVRYSEDFSAIKWEEHYLSMVFWHCQSPAENWLKIYNSPDLIEKRRRRSYYSYSKEDRLGYAEATHSYVGIALLDHLFSKNEPDCEGAFALFENILQTSLREPGLFRFDALPVFLSNLFARIPHILKNCEVDDEKKVAEYLNWLGGDYELISACIYGLYKNGYDVSELDNLGKVFSGKSMKGILSAYLEWEEREGGKPNRYNWPSNCRAMYNDVF